MLGLLQYIAPTLQLLIGVVVLHEQMPPRAGGASRLVWVALAILTVDGVRTGQRAAAEPARGRGQRALSVASTTMTVTLSWPPAASAAATSRSAAA